MINLKRPLVFFDLETTGTQIASDKIVQIAIIKIKPDGEVEEKQTLINPGIPIPPEATEVHGITDEMVATAPYFKQIAKSLAEQLHECDFAGYNSDQFDFPMLSQEFNRCQIDFPTWDPFFIDALKVERIVNSHKLEKTFKRYTGEELEDAHDALTDTRATMSVIEKQLPILEEVAKEIDPNIVLEMDVETIDKLCQGDQKRFDFAGKCYVKDGVVFWGFGKHKDKPVLDNRSYLSWVLNAEFPAQTKRKLNELIIANQE